MCCNAIRGPGPCSLLYLDVDELRPKCAVERIRTKSAGVDRPRHEFPERLEFTWKAALWDLMRGCMSLLVSDDFEWKWGVEAVAQGDNGPVRGRELEIADLPAFIKYAVVPRRSGRRRPSRDPPPHAIADRR